MEFFSFASSLWFLCIAAFIVGFTSGMWIDSKWRRKEQKSLVDEEDDEAKALEVIVGKWFVNETVSLDGKQFVKCHFENVKLIYNGGPIALQHNEFCGSFGFAATEKKAQRFLEFLVQMRLCDLPIMHADGRLLTAEQVRTSSGNLVIPRQRDESQSQSDTEQKKQPPLKTKRTSRMD